MHVRRILSELAQQTLGLSIEPSAWAAVSSGASGRSILRAEGLVGIHWTNARADNHSFLPAAKGLRRVGVPVPEVLAACDLPDECGACLVTDLGTCDLLSLKDASFEEQRKAYEETFRSLHKLHTCTPDWLMQPPFDAKLYHWEQEYFAEHYIGRHLGKSPRLLLQSSALRDMAFWLSELPRTAVHRDCQSQNVMLCRGKAYLIDFQGMRLGRPEYDIASLLYDPYMEHSPKERRLLLDLWRDIVGNAPDADIFAACALQRLMQALGAFANIGYNQERSWYLSMISPGTTALVEAARQAPKQSIAGKAAQEILSLIKP